MHFDFSDEKMREIMNRHKDSKVVKSVSGLKDAVLGLCESIRQDCSRFDGKWMLISMLLLAIAASLIINGDVIS